MGRMNFLVFATILAYSIITGFTNPVLLSNSEPKYLPSNADNTYSCPVGYSQPNNSNWPICYKIYNNFKSRKDASAQCKYDGGNLASVPNAFVNSFIYTLATQIGATSLWLGIQCFDGDVNNCFNDDGTAFIYNNFYPGNPNDAGNCVYMCDAGKCSQKWLSFGCEQDFQYACEVPAGTYAVRTTKAPAPPTFKPALNCPTNYTYYQGMCYMKTYVPNGETRDVQGEHCRRIPGGNLATITNVDLNVFLQNMPSQNQYFRIGLTCPDIKSNGDTSSCVWDDGTKFSFNYFAKGYPKGFWANRNPCIYVLNFKWQNDGGELDCNGDFSSSVCQAPPF